MRKILILLLAAVPMVSSAQVEKRVEVTKEYVPSVVDAQKIAVAPDMTDTTALRPDIDYAIMPLAMTTTLTTTPIRPATVTYWEFNRSKPVYLKLGAGWPLNTVADLYATTQNPGTGYLTGYINHDGRFAHSGDLLPGGAEADASRMYNRVGVAAGKYIGKHILEGEISYDNQLFYRPGVSHTGEYDQKYINFDEFNVLVRLGDDFKDLSRMNFNLALRGALFNDRTELTSSMLHARQTHLGVDGALARQFGRHLFRVDAMYEYATGTRSIDDYRQHILKGAVRYGYVGHVAVFEIGADYYYDKILGAGVGAADSEGAEYSDSYTNHYVIPALKLMFNVNRGFVPFLEIDGTLRDNSLRTLMKENPYVAPGVWSDDYRHHTAGLYEEAWTGRSTVVYNFRAGIRGGTAHGKFAYSLYGAYEVSRNQLYWVAYEAVNSGAPLTFYPLQGHRSVWSVRGELEYKPMSRLLFNARVRADFYKDDAPCENGLPMFRAELGVRYSSRKVSFGVRAEMQSERKWTIDWADAQSGMYGLYRVPFTLDLSADIDWRITPGFGIFGEVRNIADAKRYDWPYYRQYGVNFTAGIKLVF